MDKNTDSGSKNDATRQAEPCCESSDYGCCCVGAVFGDYVCDYEFPKPTRTYRLNAWFDRMSLTYKIGAFISFWISTLKGFTLIIDWFVK